MSGLITRDALLKPAPRRYTEARLSDGQAVRLRSLTERERSEFEAGLLDQKGGIRKDRLLSARRRLICLTLVDEQNNPLFTLAEEGLLAEQDGKLTEEIYTAAAAHCGIRDADVETIVKNSPATPAAGSP